MTLTNIYLPIAELAISPVMLLVVGFAVGVVSALFGVGGGFLAIPLLIFIGIPPSVAVGTTAMLVLATSAASTVGNVTQQRIDYKFVAYMVGGSFCGSYLGVILFRMLKEFGHIDLFTKLGLVVLLSLIGGVTLIESLSTLRKESSHNGGVSLRQGRWVKALPLRVFFHESRIYRSILLPIGIGFIAGVLSGILGIGGGFILVPALIYIVRMPLSLVLGSVMLQMTILALMSTFLQSSLNGSVDIIAAVLLIVGSLIGARYGSAWSIHLQGNRLRLGLGLLMLMVAGQTLYEALRIPRFIFSIVPV